MGAAPPLVVQPSSNAGHLHVEKGLFRRLIQTVVPQEGGHTFGPVARLQ
jgi:hypothetical protein